MYVCLYVYAMQLVDNTVLITARYGAHYCADNPFVPLYQQHQVAGCK
jgi:hypothetical protein